MHRYNFVPDEKFVEKAISKLPSSSDFVVSSWNVQHVGGRFETDYICLIC